MMDDSNSHRDRFHFGEVMILVSAARVTRFGAIIVIYTIFHRYPLALSDIDGDGADGSGWYLGRSSKFLARKRHVKTSDNNEGDEANAHQARRRRHSRYDGHDRPLKNVLYSPEKKGGEETSLTVVVVVVVVDSGSGTEDAQFDARHRLHGRKYKRKRKKKKDEVNRGRNLEKQFPAQELDCW